MTYSHNFQKTLFFTVLSTILIATLGFLPVSSAYAGHSHGGGGGARGGGHRASAGHAHAAHSPSRGASHHASAKHSAGHPAASNSMHSSTKPSGGNHHGGGRAERSGGHHQPGHHVYYRSSPNSPWAVYRGFPEHSDAATMRQWLSTMMGYDTFVR
jgi:hypothetical protein